MSDENPVDLTDDVRALLAEAFQVSEDQITNKTEFGDLPGWDSMGHMNMLVSLEARFDMEVDADLIAELTSVAAITEFLQKNSASSTVSN